jgi:type III pantothenate kinase
MRLMLDVGNTQIYAGLMQDGEIVLRFRKASKTGASSDEIGVFFRQVLRENGHDPAAVSEIGICSVVPDATHSLRNACIKYFSITPFHLNGTIKTGLSIDYPNPSEIGADRIANAMAAAHFHPKKDTIIIDLGTATTFCVLSQEAQYRGGAIMAGLRLNIEALESKTSKLPSVEIVKPQTALGRTTTHGLQAGLYYGHLGAMRELIMTLSLESFGHDQPFVIGTGGFSSLFEQAGLFHAIKPDLVLYGIDLAMDLNSA